MNTYSLSQVKDFNQCPVKWTFKSYLKFDPIKKAEALTSGSITHNCLARFYQCPPDQRSFHVLENALNTSWADSNVSTDDYASISDTVYKRLKKYWNQYSDDTGIVADSVEHKYVIEYDTYNTVIVPDLIVSNGKGFALWETKTGKPNMENLVFDDPQTLIYLSELAELQVPIEYIIYQVIPDSGKCMRLEVDYDAYEIALINKWFHLKIHDIILYQQLLDEIKVDPIENRTALIEFAHYGWSCGMCQYNILCRGIRQVLDIDELIENNYTRGETVERD